MFRFFYWIEGIVTKKWALVSLDLDKRAKSCDRLKIRDYSAKKIFMDGSLAEIKKKKKNSTEQTFTKESYRTKNVR